MRGFGLKYWILGIASENEVTGADIANRIGEITTIQINYNVFHRKSQNDLIKYCEQNHIAVMAYFPLGHGKVTQKQYNEYFDHVRKTVGDVPNANIALAYLISKNQNVFPIPRASNRTHVTQNAKYADIILKEGDIKYLEEKL